MPYIVCSEFVHANNTTEVKMIDAIDVTKNSSNQVNKEQAQKEAVQLLMSCAQDVVNYWPNMSFKTIRVMIPKMQALKEALEMLK